MNFGILNVVKKCIPILTTAYVSAAPGIYLLWVNPTSVKEARIYESAGSNEFVFRATVLAPTNHYKPVLLPNVPMKWRVVLVDTNGIQSHPYELGYDPVKRPALESVVIGVYQNVLTNGDFRAGMNGWTATGNVKCSSANRLLFNANSTAPNGTVSQCMDTVAGCKYTISLEAGIWSGSTGPRAQALAVSVVGGTNIFWETVPLSSLGVTGPAKLVPFEFSFVADGPTTLILRDASPVTDNADIVVDNVQVVYSP